MNQKSDKRQEQRQIAAYTYLFSLSFRERIADSERSEESPHNDSIFRSHGKLSLIQFHLLLLRFDFSYSDLIVFDDSEQI